ncbi:lysozyme family protein [Bacillus massilinigeriensis]|uniref:lysozyme family protein n=1 Tax=Bacillus mediterraneensis TaxID=1805474 RepID=UPI0008F92529|nr:lysozyme family protein [Bacillus mediterraneensis]
MKKKKNKKSVKRNFKLLLLLFFTIIAAFVIDEISEKRLRDQAITLIKSYPSEEVEAYAPVIQKKLDEVELGKYTAVVAAIMQQESRGKGGDPMQASESIGLPPNSITNPEESIDAGIKHFARTVKYGEEKNVDFPTVIQAYNMGTGYIDYVASRGGKHSENIAKEFSALQVQKNPDKYNCGGDKNNFRSPYCYGDFTYATKVQKNIQVFTAKNHDIEFENPEKAGS